MNIMLINLILWGIVGAFAGLTVGQALVQVNHGRNMVTDTIAGIIGGLVGGLLMRILNLVGESELNNYIHFPSIVVALVVALVIADMADMIQSAEH